jgi:hypothetical protein
MGSRAGLNTVEKRKFLSLYAVCGEKVSIGTNFLEENPSLRKR